MTFQGVKSACPTTWAEAWLLIQIFGLIVLLRVFLPYIKLPKLLTWLTPKRVPATAHSLLLARGAYYVDGLLRRFQFRVPGQCLPRSLVLFYVANRLGYPVTFRCGVQRQGEALKGHAWLSRDGTAFLESGSPEKQFVVTFSFPAT